MIFIAILFQQFSKFVYFLLGLLFIQNRKPPYSSFVIGASCASTRLMPVGAGKAISSSIVSPSPCTFTTVPVPHFLCFALSPGAHVSPPGLAVLFIRPAL